MSKSSSSASSRDERRRSRTPPPSSSPFRDRSKTTTSRLSRSSSATSLAPSDTVTTSSLFEDLNLNPNYNPRSFPFSVKQQCWDKADKVNGRDPERWRRDALGNIVFRKLVGCPGCLCHDYDHILPFSKGKHSQRRKLQTMTELCQENNTSCTFICIHIPCWEGGESTLENCQVLQATVNRSKGNRTDMSKADLIQKSRYCKVSDRDMDLLEISAYGNVQRGPDSGGGCRIQ